MTLNKIKVSTVKLNSDITTLKIKENDSIYYISNEVKVKEIVFPNQAFHTTFVLEENSTLDCGCILNIKNCHGVIKIESTKNTHLHLYLGISASGKNDLTIENIVTNNNNESEIKVRMVGENDSHTFLKTVGVLKKDTLANMFLEDVKYLNEEESYIECLPELIVDSNDVEAFHNVTIGNITDEVLFYLESKNISINIAKKLIRDGFLKSMIRNGKEVTYED